MTLASRLLEGYCPEGYDIVEEGLTPDVVMERTNSICIECIQGLYEAAEDFFTGDLIAQTQVLTEGVGVIDKIKELIGKFVEKIKNIWDWFIGKVKRFPAWFKSLFSKAAENTDTLIGKFEGIGINHKEVTAPDLSVIDKAVAEINKVQKSVQTCSQAFVKAVSLNGDPTALLADAEDTIAEMAKSYKPILQSYEYDGMDDEDIDEFKKQVDDIESEVNKHTNVANSMLNSAKSVQVDKLKVIACAKNVRKNIIEAEKTTIKPLSDAINQMEKSLTVVKSDSFKARLEKAFVNNTIINKSDRAATQASQVASKYVSGLSKEMSFVVSLMNKLLSVAKSLITGYNNINSKLIGSIKSKTDDSSKDKE